MLELEIFENMLETDMFVYRHATEKIQYRNDNQEIVENICGDA